MHRKKELMPVPQSDLAAVRPGEGRVHLRALERAADLGNGGAAVDLGADGLAARPRERTLHLLEPPAGLGRAREGTAGGPAAKARFILIA